MSHIFTVRPSQFEVDHVHAFVAGERYAEQHGGELPENGFWRDIEFRYDRNPHAFSIVHPNFKLLLDRLERSHDGNHANCPTDAHRWIGRMRGPVVPSCPIEPPLNPQTVSVAEPASFVMGVACVAVWLGAAIVLGRRDSRK